MTKLEAEGPQYSTALSKEEAVVYTVLSDRATRGDGPATLQEVVLGTAWPGARTFGAARARRILRSLDEGGYVRRIATRAGGVRWEVRR